MDERGVLHKWWWNGRWGRLARRDVKVYKRGQVHTVEAWEGGVEGRCRRWHKLDQGSAIDLVTDLMSDSDGWQKMDVTLSNLLATPGSLIGREAGEAPF